MACNSKGSSLLEEKKLSETVRYIPVLNDRSKKGFKERDAVTNAWTEVARSLDFIENWDDAKNLLENFKMFIFFLDVLLYQAQKMSKHIGGHSQISKKCYKLFYLFPFHNTFNSSYT